MKLHIMFFYVVIVLAAFITDVTAETANITHTSQEKYLLLDVEKLDDVMGVTKVEDGQELTYRLRSLDAVVDYITQYTNDEHHGHGEDYQLWREQLRKPHPTVETFKYFFAQASQEFGVPIDILEAIGYVESNWTQMGPSIDRGWGVMHLVQNNYADTLGEAATLLNLEPQVLKDEARQNIRGAAALIAQYAGEQRHDFTQLEDWFEAVKQFSGLINEELRELQALRYYEVIKMGTESQTLWGETITLASHPDVLITPDQIKRTNTRRSTRSTDYAPAISNLTTCNYTSRSSRTIDTWVNHWIGSGTYAGAISWFHNCDANVSAHFVVRASDGQITQVVRTKDMAWHARGYNHRSIGVEHEVTIANSNGWNTTWTTSLLKASAEMAHYFVDKYNIPRTRATIPGILGHNEIPDTNTDCPGTFPWDKWMSYFNGGGDIRLYSSVTISPNPIIQGSPVTISVKVANYGSDTFRGNIAAALHSTSGQLLGDIERKDNEIINAGYFKDYTFYKSTVLSGPGSYQLQIKYQPSGASWDIIPKNAYVNPVYVQIQSGDNTIASANQYINKCVRTFQDYFGDAESEIYTCYTDFLCQNTTGGLLGDVVAIAVRKDLAGDVFYYYWGGWSALSLAYCN